MPNLISTLINVGFSTCDAYLLCWCPVFSAIGALIRGGLILTPLDRKPHLRTPKSKEELLSKILQWFYKFDWVIGWAVRGLGTGLLTALLFVGIPQDIYTVARILAVSIIAGYSGASFWNRQEQLLNRLILETKDSKQESQIR